MTLRYESAGGDRDVLRIPVIRVAFALSVMIHAAALWPWMKPLNFLAPPEKTEKAASRLQVRLAPVTVPETSASTARAAPARRSRPPARATRPSPRSPAQVLALDSHRPDIADPVASSIPESTAAPPVRSTNPNPISDMAALIESRRQSRGNPTPPPLPAPQPAEDDNRRRDRIVAENLGSQRTPTFGRDPRGSGGIFQVEHIYYDYADFTFFGWNKDIRRNTLQLIEVRKGNASDIRIAVVRKMIAVIREYEQEEFRWDSTRLGRSIVLSARQRDSAGLEDFLMTEFFEDFQRRR
ncbi:MAG: hypothetical protein EXR28_12130 [Betaproteobacteria bacterium]|nr:hypothetical protein [Betaproteobacteria bacterium]